MWNMEWIVQGLPRPTQGLCHGARGPGLLGGEGSDSSFLWSSYCRGVGGLSSPPQPPAFSGLPLPSAQQRGPGLPLPKLRLQLRRGEGVPLGGPAAQ